jgi:hypothetical protein
MHARRSDERSLVVRERGGALGRVTTNGVLLLAVLSSSAACAHVTAYERGDLAHPTMTTSDIVSPSEEHARSVQEGAVGGGGSAGGGCGCN